MDGCKGAIFRLADAFHREGRFKSLHSFGESLATADLGDDIADDVQHLGGFLIEGLRPRWS